MPSYYTIIFMKKYFTKFFINKNDFFKKYKKIAFCDVSDQCILANYHGYSKLIFHFALRNLNNPSKNPRCMIC